MNLLANRSLIWTADHWSVAELTAADVRAASVAEIEGYIAHTERQID